MERLENWKEFLDKYVRVIINDPPSLYPKHKDGIVKAFTSTHLILQQEKEVALLLSDIRRIEIRDEAP